MSIEHRLRDDFPADRSSQAPRRPHTHLDLPYAIRAAYLEAAVDRKNRVSHAETDKNLRRRKLYAQGVIAADGSGEVFEDADFSTNTRTALKQLGVDPDPMIRRYLVCPGCFSLTPYSDLYLLDSPTCQELVYKKRERVPCGADIYTVHETIRTPMDVMPVTPMSSALEYLFQDREFVSNLQSWRREEDGVESPAEDTHRDVLDPTLSYTDNSFAMEGIADGAAWRSHAAYCRRELRDDGEVVDVAEGPCMMRYASLEFGLYLVLNVDWYVISWTMHRTPVTLFSCS
jgi:hypothetical protein